ncbi:uncharacterized protein A4U43_C07F36940 [Asparagus officinalis]|uniref:Glycosyl transferase family 1 domain-containing protein n=1 Tax=Asparagus officinalis TaxID=4686 RepID=A0A5P1EI47_ASPOF|nr:uncharacterized protein A4U43_C07F36940 [Asparagus officinalis]
MMKIEDFDNTWNHRSCWPREGNSRLWLFRLNFLSVNRFERKKNLQLAISAFALLRSLGSTLPDQSLSEATLTIAGGFDKRLKENVEYLEELKELAETEGVSDRVR